MIRPVLDHRFRLGRFVLAARRNRGWDIPHSLLYALERNNDFLIRSFK